MFEVIPIQDKAEQQSLCAACRIPFDVDAMAYKAGIDGKFSGICQFRIGKQGGVITHLAPAPDSGLSDVDVFTSLFALGRATLNFLDLCGDTHVEFADTACIASNPSIVRSVGFTPDSDGHYTMDTTDFFSSPCRHDTEKPADSNRIG